MSVPPEMAESIARAEAEARNGHDSSEAAVRETAARGMTPRILEWLKMPGAYGEAGQEIQCWINHPAQINEALGATPIPEDLQEPRPDPEAERERQREVQELRERGTERRKKALKAIVRGHRVQPEGGPWLYEDWEDPDDGGEPRVKPLPPTSEDRFWDIISHHQLGAIMSALNSRVMNVENTFR